MQKVSVQSLISLVTDSQVESTRKDRPEPETRDRCCDFVSSSLASGLLKSAELREFSISDFLNVNTYLNILGIPVLTGQLTTEIKNTHYKKLKYTQWAISSYFINNCNNGFQLFSCFYPTSLFTALGSK